jgi:hypothetical protein
VPERTGGLTRRTPCIPGHPASSRTGAKPDARISCWARSGGWCQRRRGNADATAPPPGPPGGRFLISLGRSSTVELRSPKPMVEGSIPSVPAKPCLRAKRLAHCQLHSGKRQCGRQAARIDAWLSRPACPVRESQAPGPLAHCRKSACVASRRCGVRAPGGPRAASITGDALDS